MQRCTVRNGAQSQEVFVSTELVRENLIKHESEDRGKQQNQPSDRPTFDPLRSSQSVAL
ncbi:MAG: hypothetical protein JSU63_02790 [Phycisphaerales bacterium]|nr:MAG: hypothetical protein JSU63_02790 [Phycisphaerales bacterium]